MIKNFLRKAVLINGIFLLAMAVAVPQALAKKNQLLITNVFVDFANNDLIINGQNFENNVTPVVTLANQELNVPAGAYNDTTINADLPTGLEDGYYLLRVSTGKGKKDNDSYDLTFGVNSPTMTLDDIYNKIGSGSASGNSAPVSKTGQTTFNATGDDGDLQKGVSWPNPRFTANGDGTIMDNLTGLIWDKNANRLGTQTWTSALSACNNLEHNGGDLTDSSQAGDWRLPNVKELQSLVHYGFYNPALPDTLGTGQWTAGEPFSNVRSSLYWSSTTGANYASFAWGVGFNGGYVGYDFKTLNFYAWCVRGGL